MNKLYTLLIAVLVIAFTGSLAFAEVDVAAIVKNHPVQADYADFESVILYEGITYKIDTEGRISRTVHRVRTLFTENALDEFGDPHIGYFADKQDLSVNICRGYMLDGRAIDTQANGLNQITPGALWQYPDYTGFQQLVATHTGLEWGGTSEIKYTISDREKVQEWMEGIEYFQSDEPILRKEVTIIHPDNVELKYSFLNGEGNLKKTVKDGYTTRVWHMENVPGIQHDDAFRFRMDYTPTLIFSTCSSWKYGVSYYADMANKAAEPSDYIRKAADEALSGCKNPEMVVEKLAKLVRERIRIVNYNWEFFPWYHRDAERTLASCYGNRFDAAILLISLLKSQGIKAWAGGSTDVFEREFKVPRVLGFDRIWVLAEYDGKQLHIDPASSLSGRSELNLAGQAVFFYDYNWEYPRVIPAYTAKENYSVLSMRLKVKEDGSYSGGGMFKAGGNFSPYYECLENSEGTEGWLKSNIGGKLPNLKVDKGSARDLTPQYCEFTYNFNGENLGEVMDGFLTIPVPVSPKDVSILEPSGWHASHNTRSNPIYFKGIGSSTVQMTIELPDNWQAVSLPKEFAKESSAVEALISSAVQDKQVTLTVTYSIKVQKVSADYYPVLRNLHQAWVQTNNKYLVFKVTAE